MCACLLNNLKIIYLSNKKRGETDRRKEKEREREREGKLHQSKIPYQYVPLLTQSFDLNDLPVVRI